MQWLFLDSTELCSEIAQLWLCAKCAKNVKISHGLQHSFREAAFVRQLYVLFRWAALATFAQTSNRLMIFRYAPAIFSADMTYCLRFNWHRLKLPHAHKIMCEKYISWMNIELSEIDSFRMGCIFSMDPRSEKITAADYNQIGDKQCGTVWCHDSHTTLSTCIVMPRRAIEKSTRNIAE